jgi:hypothetical protein
METAPDEYIPARCSSRFFLINYCSVKLISSFFVFTFERENASSNSASSIAIVALIVCLLYAHNNAGRRLAKSRISTSSSGNFCNFRDARSRSSKGSLLVKDNI